MSVDKVSYLGVELVYFVDNNITLLFNMYEDGRILNVDLNEEIKCLVKAKMRENLKK